MKWNCIVDKGFPPVDEDVLVYDHGNVYVASFTGRFAKRKEGGEVPIWDDGEGALGVMSFSPPPYPTHWVELPKEPPREETEMMVVVE